MSRPPIVFLPGFPASELRLAESGELVFPPSLRDLTSPARRERWLRWLSGETATQDALVAGEPIRSVLGIFREAQTLYDLLRSYCYSVSTANDFFSPVGWDWRRAVDDPGIQDAAESAIATLAARSGPVVLIAHSTGGLILRALLEERPHLAAGIARIVAFGVPWAGTLTAVRYLVRGQKLGLPELALGLSAREVRRIMRGSQAAYDLFPPGPPGTDLRSPSGESLNLVVTGPAGSDFALLAEPCWIPKNQDCDFMREHAASAHARLGERADSLSLPAVDPPPITNVAAWGMQTLTQCAVDAGSGALSFAPATKEGDGTVPFASASWLRGDGTRTFPVPIGVYPLDGIPHPHAAIWSSPAVRQILDQVLAGKPPEPFVWGAADHDEAIDPESDVTVRLVAADENGRPLPNAEILLHDFDPEAIPFGDDVRHEITLRRAGLRANVGSDLYRSIIEVRWDGGVREIPILFRI